MLFSGYCTSLKQCAPQHIHHHSGHQPLRVATSSPHHQFSSAMEKRNLDHFDYHDQQHLHHDKFMSHRICTGHTVQTFRIVVGIGCL